jgi:hypothetical protein
MKVLQTFALPLGYRTSEKNIPKNKKPTTTNRGQQKFRAFVKSLPARTLLPTNATTHTTARAMRKREFVSENHAHPTYCGASDMSTAIFPRLQRLWSAAA